MKTLKLGLTLRIPIQQRDFRVSQKNLVKCGPKEEHKINFFVKVQDNSREKFNKSTQVYILRKDL